MEKTKNAKELFEEQFKEMEIDPFREVVVKINELENEVNSRIKGIREETQTFANYVNLHTNSTLELIVENARLSADNKQLREQIGRNINSSEELVNIKTEKAEITSEKKFWFKQWESLLGQNEKLEEDILKINKEKIKFELEFNNAEKEKQQLNDALKEIIQKSEEKDRKIEKIEKEKTEVSSKFKEKKNQFDSMIQENQNMSTRLKGQSERIREMEDCILSIYNSAIKNLSDEIENTIQLIADEKMSDYLKGIVVEEAPSFDGIEEKIKKMINRPDKALSRLLTIRLWYKDKELRKVLCAEKDFNTMVKMAEIIVNIAELVGYKIKMVDQLGIGNPPEPYESSDEYTKVASVYFNDYFNNKKQNIFCEISEVYYTDPNNNGHPGKMNYSKVK